MTPWYPQLTEVANVRTNARIKDGEELQWLTLLDHVIVINEFAFVYFQTLAIFNQTATQV